MKIAVSLLFFAFISGSFASNDLARDKSKLETTLKSEDNTRNKKCNYKDLLCFSTFSVGGCWGQPMLLFWKLIHKTQMSNPPEAASYRNSTKLLILLPLRAIYFYSLHYETPCKNMLFCLQFFCPTDELCPLQPSKLEQKILCSLQVPGNRN